MAEDTPFKRHSSGFDSQAGYMKKETQKPESLARITWRRWKAWYIIWLVIAGICIYLIVTGRL